MLRLPTALALAAATAGALWGAVLARWHLDGRTSVLDRIETPLADLRFLVAGPRKAPSEVVIVALDDRTLRAFGPPPLPRPAVAHLVRELAKRQPRAIGLDILFIDPATREGDDDLAAACRQARAVVAAVGQFSREQEPGSAPSDFANVPSTTDVLWPIPALRAVAGIGLVNVSTDHAGTPRHVPLLIRANDALLPSFPLRLAMAATQSEPAIDADGLSLGNVATATDLGYYLPLRFYGPRGTVRTISAIDVLHGSLGDDALRDRIVVVGATALGMGDTFATPFDPVLPGVEVLATATAHLIAGDGLVRSQAIRRVDAAVAVALPIVVVLLIASRRVGLGLALAAALMALWAALATYAFARGAWFSLSLPLATALPTSILFAAARLWLEHRIGSRLARSEQVFRRLQAPALAEALAKSPDFLARPIRQDAAVLFVDLTAFTGYSEQIGPERTRELLWEFHTIVEDVVTRHGGSVLDYMGDGALILFGLPQARHDDPCRALATALALAERVRLWLAESPSLREAVGVKLGGHFGPVIVSRLGAATHQQLTASGDCVNVASRLLEIAAAHNALVAVSADLFEAAQRRDPTGCAPASSFTEEVLLPIRGRRQALAVRFWGSRLGSASEGSVG